MDGQATTSFDIWLCQGHDYAKYRRKDTPDNSERDNLGSLQNLGNGGRSAKSSLK